MKVLVVEEEERIARFLRRGLEEEGYAVELAGDGPAGLERALSGIHDLVVLDLMLPGLSGLEVLRRLRASGKAIPVLMLTTREPAPDGARVPGAGTDDYLTKPFSFEEFLARVRALLRRGQPGREPVLRVGDLTLDAAAKKAARADRRIDLSSREFAILEYLMRNAGQVLSRTRIYEHVWEGRYDGLTNVVDVYINFLRRKLEYWGEPRMIHTQRGQGYMLRAADPPS